MATMKLSQGERFFQETRTATFRKEEFQYIHMGIIDADGEAWTTTELDEANIFQVYNQYRAKHGIPFPDEIIGLRKHYGLSAAKMAQILGFGINQYRVYEDGEVPNLSNARTIIAAREKDVFLSFLEASKSDMSESEYHRTKRKIESANGDYISSNHPTSFTGYRTMSLEKISAVANMLIAKIGPIFVTKMNKMLFYADFLHYKKCGYGITGITYRALQFGPVPESWGKIYESLSGILMEEFVYPSGQSGVLLETKGDTTDGVLTEAEIDTVKRVCELFAEMTAGEISDTSHKEKAWIDNNSTHEVISYQDAFFLNYD